MNPNEVEVAAPVPTPEEIEKQRKEKLAKSKNALKYITGEIKDTEGSYGKQFTYFLENIKFRKQKQDVVIALITKENEQYKVNPQAVREIAAAIKQKYELTGKTSTLETEIYNFLSLIIRLEQKSKQFTGEIGKDYTSIDDGNVLNAAADIAGCMQEASGSSIFREYTVFFKYIGNNRLGNEKSFYIDAFKEFFENLYNLTPNRDFQYTFDSLLITPIQRYPRYELFSKELVKNYPAADVLPEEQNRKDEIIEASEEIAKFNHGNNKAADIGEKITEMQRGAASGARQKRNNLAKMGFNKAVNAKIDIAAKFIELDDSFKSLIKTKITKGNQEAFNKVILTIIEIHKITHLYARLRFNEGVDAKIQNFKLAYLSKKLVRQLQDLGKDVTLHSIAEDSAIRSEHLNEQVEELKNLEKKQPLEEYEQQRLKKLQSYKKLKEDAKNIECFAAMVKDIDYDSRKNEINQYIKKEGNLVIARQNQDSTKEEEPLVPTVKDKGKLLPLQVEILLDKQGKSEKDFLNMIANLTLVADIKADSETLGGTLKKNLISLFSEKPPERFYIEYGGKPIIEIFYNQSHEGKKIAIQLNGTEEEIPTEAKHYYEKIFFLLCNDFANVLQNGIFIKAKQDKFSLYPLEDSQIIGDSLGFEIGFVGNDTSKLYITEKEESQQSEENQQNEEHSLNFYQEEHLLQSTLPYGNQSTIGANKKVLLEQVFEEEESPISTDNLDLGNQSIMEQKPVIKRVDSFEGFPDVEDLEISAIEDADNHWKSLINHESEFYKEHSKQNLKEEMKAEEYEEKFQDEITEDKKDKKDNPKESEEEQKETKNNLKEEDHHDENDLKQEIKVDELQDKFVEDEKKEDIKVDEVQDNPKESEEEQKETKNNLKEEDNHNENDLNQETKVNEGQNKLVKDEKKKDIEVVDNPYKGLNIAFNNQQTSLKRFVRNEWFRQFENASYILAVAIIGFVTALAIQGFNFASFGSGDITTVALATALPALITFFGKFALMRFKKDEIMNADNADKNDTGSTDERRLNVFVRQWAIKDLDYQRLFTFIVLGIAVAGTIGVAIAAFAFGQAEFIANIFNVINGWAGVAQNPLITAGLAVGSLFVALRVIDFQGLFRKVQFWGIDKNTGELVISDKRTTADELEQLKAAGAPKHLLFRVNEPVMDNKARWETDRQGNKTNMLTSIAKEIGRGFGN